MFKRNWANPAAQDFAFNQLHHKPAVFDAIDLCDVGRLPILTLNARRSRTLTSDWDACTFFRVATIRQQ